MLWYRSIILLFALTISTYAQDGPKPDPAKAKLDAQKLQKIDELFEGSVKKKDIAGSVALIIRDGQVGYLKAAGMADIENNIPMKTDAIFRICSMTKPVTSVAAMILVDDGKLSLDDPIAKYLPEFKAPKVLVGTELVPAKNAITVKHLITHTSGIPYRFIAKKGLVEYYIKAGVHDGLSVTDLDLAENVKKIASQPLSFEPGTAWEYGLNTDVLGRVIEVVSGKTLAEFFQERILTPLGMNSTAFFVNDKQKEKLAAVYEQPSKGSLSRLAEKDKVVGALVYSPSYPYEGAKKYCSGGAGLCASTEDYGKFLQMLLNGGQLNGKRILKGETAKAMVQNQIGEIPMGFGGLGNKFGLGFGVVTDRVAAKEISMNGTYSWGGFYHTYFFVDPEKKLIAIFMSQIYPSGHTGLNAGFKKLVYDSLVD